MVKHNWFAATLVIGTACFGQFAPELGQGWLPEFNLAARQVLALAEATPAAKYAWSPAPGVRSTSEVYMHIAIGNFSLLRHAGAQIPAETLKALAAGEKKITAKEDVTAWLKKSFDAVRENYATLDRQKKLTFFGKETDADGVFLRILVHNHEHMGQSIAYARMSGIAPPWSKKDSKE